ncbi:MAG: WD40 repeat protein, partial [Planctomycetota bacterium]
MLIATLLFTSSLQLSSIEAASPPVQAARAVAEFGSNDLRHLARLEDLEYSPDGATVAAVSVDGHLNLWSSESGALLGNFRQPSGSPLFQVTFLDPQTLLYGAGTNRLGALGIQSDGVLEEAPLERFGLGDLQDSGGGVSVAPGGEYLCQWILA